MACVKEYKLFLTLLTENCNDNNTFGLGTMQKFKNL